MPTPECNIYRLGRTEYRQAWDLQVSLAGSVHRGELPNCLLLVEHPHVFTKGRLSPPEQILLSAEELLDRGIKVYETDRGGLVTYHGPGQLVAYPVVSLRGWGGPLKYVRTLERIIVEALACLGIAAGVEPGLTGVWVDDAKIAAIGVKVSRGVAYHGFAVNVNTDLSFFDCIVPCGIADRGVTSISQLVGQPVDIALVDYYIACEFGRGMGFRMVEADAASLLGRFLHGSDSPSLPTRQLFPDRNLGTELLHQKVPRPCILPADFPTLAPGYSTGFKTWTHMPRGPVCQRE
jgi:lipoyl(octanoyl) transferase